MDVASIYVPDVGHGLAAGFSTVTGERVQIDCGDKDDGKLAFAKGLQHICPDVFVLSHFHWDHYSGIVYGANLVPRPRFAIKQVCYPRMPEFPKPAQKTQLMVCFLAMAERVLGSDTGHITMDFLNVLSRINNHKFVRKPLSENDTLQIGQHRFEVLGPPRDVNAETLKSVDRAIAEFMRAVDQDDELRAIHQLVQSSGVVDTYLNEPDGVGEPVRDERVPETNGVSVTNPRIRNLPETTAKANGLLRDVANSLSVVFCADDDLLFMGDLKGREISRVVRKLMGARRERFAAMISPHHGTQWHDTLALLRCDWVLSSVGGKLLPHVKHGYRSVSGNHLLTCLHGDIWLPVNPTCVCCRGFGPCRPPFV